MKKLIKNTHPKKQGFIITCIVILLLSAFTASAQKADFSGKWSRDTDRTTLGESLSINSVPVLLEVSQTTDAISITHHSVNGKGESHAYNETIRFGGSPATVAVTPNLNKSSALHWSADQKSFTDVATFTDAQGNPSQKNTQTWSLSDGGKTLTIHAVIESDGQTFTADEVFNRE